MPFASNFFTKQEQQLIIDAIAQAELNTSGEIRVHLDNFCFGDEVKAAKKVFTRLNMHRTAERNGVLIYLATLSRKIAIVGDEGIHSKLGNTYWETMVQGMISQLKANHKAEALQACIIDCGTQLGKYFPRKKDDKNELPNSISF